MMIDVISFYVGQMFLFNKSLNFETDVLRQYLPEAKKKFKSILVDRKFKQWNAI